MSAEHSRTTSKSKTERYFDIYAANLRLVRQHPYVEIRYVSGEVFDIDDTVMCPICFDKFFYHTAIEEKVITLEHVPPRALGGRPRTITCRYCNNLYSKFDEHLRQRTKIQPFLDGLPGASIGGVRIAIKGGPSLRGVLKLPATADGGFQLIADQLKQPHYEKVAEAISHPDGGEFTTRILIPTQDKENVNLVRIAYLWLFSVFGYGLIVHPNYESIREQLRNPTTEMLHNWGLIEIKSAEFTDEFTGVNIVYQPTELRSFLVVFDLKPRNGVTSRRAVLLPGPGTPSHADIKSWLEQNCSGNTSQLRAYHLGTRCHGKEFNEPFLVQS